MNVEIGTEAAQFPKRITKVYGVLGYVTNKLNI